MYEYNVRQAEDFSNFGEMAELSKGNESLVFVQNGKVSRVLISAEAFEVLEDYRFDRYLIQKIEEAENDPDQRDIPYEEVWAQLKEAYDL